MNLGTATVIRGDARHLPLPDDSVDLICTSPPYFALRSYQDGGEHYPGQIGSEATPPEWLDALIECTREWMRVLKPSGSLWVNLGDKYSTSLYSRTGTVRTVPQPDGDWSLTGRRGEPNRQASAQDPAVPNKSLIGIPWRYAIRCIDELGLILRAEIIWSKPNGLPESVTDRVRRSHEQWFHMVTQPRYFAAVDEIREAHSENGHARRSDGATTPKQSAGLGLDVRRGYMAETYTNPLGKLPGSVREIPSEPLTVPDHLGVDHFAAFPTAWPRWIIQGWSPAGICCACGEGRRPVADVEKVPTQKTYNGRDFRRHAQPMSGGMQSPLPMRDVATITGYACACPTPDGPTRPAVILDPFGGTGTTALVAKALGRHGISVDLSHDYSRLARWRTNDPAQLAKVCGVDKPPAQTNGQIDLFEETA